MINENININETVTIMVDTVEKPVLSIYGNINVNRGNTSVGFEVIDKALLDANKDYVIGKKDEFMAVFNQKLTDAGLIAI